MTGRVDGKVACVTGAAAGIGRATAAALAREGALVVLTDVAAEAGEAAAAALRGMGAQATFLHHDVANEAEWVAVVEAIDRRHGRIDILINNAGIGLAAPVTDIRLDDWRRQLAVNLDGTFLGVKHVLPLMRRGGGGSIVNVSSIGGIKAAPNVSGYCASKGAVRLFTKSVALECAALKDGVRVNSLHPGVVVTAIWDSLIGTTPDEDSALPRDKTMAAYAAAAVPMGRAAEPAEVAAAALWLASDESSYVTGIELLVDGGRSIG